MRTAIAFGTARATGIVPLSELRVAVVQPGLVRGRNSVTATVFRGTVKNGKVGIGAVSYPYNHTKGQQDPAARQEVVITKSATINCVVATDKNGKLVDVVKKQDGPGYLYEDGTEVPISAKGHLFYKGNLAGYILEAHRSGKSNEEISNDLVKNGYKSTPNYVDFVLAQHRRWDHDSGEMSVSDRLNDRVLDVNDTNGQFAHRVINRYFDSSSPVHNAGLQRIIPPVFYQTTEHVPVREDWLETLVLANCRSEAGIIGDEYVGQAFVVNNVILEEEQSRILFDILLVETAGEDEEGNPLYRTTDEAAVALPYIEGMSEILVNACEEPYEVGDYVNNSDVILANTRIFSTFPMDPTLASADSIVSELKKNVDLFQAVKKLMFQLVKININGISAFRIDMLQKLPDEVNINNLFFATAGPESQVAVIEIPNGEALCFENAVLKIDLYHNPWFDRERKFAIQNQERGRKKGRSFEQKPLTERLVVPGN